MIKFYKFTLTSNYDGSIRTIILEQQHILFDGIVSKITSSMPIPDDMGTTFYNATPIEVYNSIVIKQQENSVASELIEIFNQEDIPSVTLSVPCKKPITKQVSEVKLDGSIYLDQHFNTTLVAGTGGEVITHISLVVNKQESNTTTIFNGITTLKQGDNNFWSQEIMLSSNASINEVNKGQVIVTYSDATKQSFDVEFYFQEHNKKPPMENTIPLQELTINGRIYLKQKDGTLIPKGK